MPRRIRTYRKKRPTGRKPKTYKRRTYKKRSFPRASARVPSAFQIFNKTRVRSHYFEDSYTSQSSVGSGTAFQAIVTFSMNLISRYALLKQMFNQYRVKWFKIRIQMAQIENTDGTIIPEIYIRYNYNPDVTAASLTTTVMQSWQNLIYKRMLQGDGHGADFEYLVKPAVLTAQQIVGSSNFTTAPRFNQWCDFKTLSTDEVNHYGMAVLIPTLPSGVTMTYKYTVGYECRDII